MHTIAVALQWTVLVAGFTVLVAAAVSSIRVRLSGAGFGTVVEHVERRWFGAGSVLLALLTGAAAMVVAGRLTGGGVGIDEAALVVFPLALVASFAVRRLTARDAQRTTARVTGLVVVPALLGAVMSATG
ncbi:hypothetical protein ACFC5H_01290 [Streptomyces rochei]|uniref:Uncharacterized protein n=3 Tax=Streptomyces rochei group TaxID=2867164 RepID=A0ABW7EBS6_STRRO|nr:MULTISPECIES: hypothetical protein [Streptomyces]MDV6287694.1 hypothetical protein [Streptomyces sp. UP1A-1]WDI21920.1 hypothetical protein PS783_31865 [Streptomyces enissocaesilis]MBJ6622560.1 hypothetical protein [Streptomyces sp. DHE17-7]MCC8451541.1 hypothetical protein [Streptomyces rochei]MDI3102237.1 hypothetical protein [Streptomyces sp. AN-3]